MDRLFKKYQRAFQIFFIKEQRVELILNNLQYLNNTNWINISNDKENVTLV